MEFDFDKAQSVPKGEFATKVPTDFHGLYKEAEGNMVLDSEHPGVKSAISAIALLNRSLRASRKEAGELKGKAVDLAPLADFGTSVEDINTAVRAKLQELTQKGTGDAAKVEQQVTKIKGELAKEYEGKIELSNKRAEALKAQLHGLLVTSAARTALMEADAVDADLVMPHLERQIKVLEEDGQFRVQVVDAAGDPRYNGATGAPMTVSDLVKTMKADQKYGALFKSKQPSGGGTKPAARTVPPGSEAQGEKSSAQKIADGLAARQGQR